MSSFTEEDYGVDAFHRKVRAIVARGFDRGWLIYPHNSANYELARRSGEAEQEHVARFVETAPEVLKRVFGGGEK